MVKLYKNDSFALVISSAVAMILSNFVLVLSKRNKYSDVLKNISVKVGQR